MKIKVCGVTRPEDARLACELGAFAVGLVFASGTPRALSFERARAAREEIGERALAVGVFQGNAPEEIESFARRLGLHAVQLHDPVPAPRGVLCWRVVAPGESPLPGAAALVVEPKRSAADRAAGRPLEEDVRRAAWSAAAKLKSQARFIVLAGGLTAANVAEAVALGKPDAVDVSSGVESAPGVKDAAKLRAFFNAAA